MESKTPEDLMNVEEWKEYRDSFTKEGLIYAPNSIYHGHKLHEVRRMPFSTELLLKLEVERLVDFLEFLFDKSEHLDHITYSDAWDEFEQYEINEE